MIKKITLSTFFIVMLLPIFAMSAITQTKEDVKKTDKAAKLELVSGDKVQVYQEATLSDGTPVKITIVTYPKENQAAKAAVSSAIGRLLHLDSELFSTDGVAAKLNTLEPGKTIELSVDTYALIKKAVGLSALTGGWFDVASPSTNNWFVQRDWRRIDLNDSARTLTYKSDEMKLDLTRIAKGFMTDIAMEEILRAGFQDALVEIGTISRIAGRDIFTPWNIQIGFGGKEEHAGRAYSYNLTNIAVATVTKDGLGKDLIDSRNKKPVDAKLIGDTNTTVLAADASQAVAYSLASYTLGPKIGLRYIEAHPEIKGVVVDSSGNFIVSKGFAQRRAVPSPIDEEIATPVKDKGPNDMKQKQAEEDRDQ